MSDENYAQIFGDEKPKKYKKIKIRVDKDIPQDRLYIQKIVNNDISS